MVETNIPNYYPFNKITTGFKKKPEIDLNKIVAVMASVKKLVDSFEKDTLVLDKKEKLINRLFFSTPILLIIFTILLKTKNIMNT